MKEKWASRGNDAAFYHNNGELEHSIFYRVKINGKQEALQRRMLCKTVSHE